MVGKNHKYIFIIILSIESCINPIGIYNKMFLNTRNGEEMESCAIIYFLETARNTELSDLYKSSYKYENNNFILLRSKEEIEKEAENINKRYDVLLLYLALECALKDTYE